MTKALKVAAFMCGAVIIMAAVPAPDAGMLAIWIPVMGGLGLIKMIEMIPKKRRKARSVEPTVREPGEPIAPLLAILRSDVNYDRFSGKIYVQGREVDGDPTIRGVRYKRESVLAAYLSGIPDLMTPVE